MPLPLNINTRTLLIIAGLALPVVVLGVLTIHTQKAAVQQVVAPPAPGALDAARRDLEAEKAKHRARLAEMEKMTDADWPADIKKNPRHAATREAGIAWQKNKLAELDKLTPEQWLAMHQQSFQQRQRQWEAWRKAHPAQTVPKKPLPSVNR